MAIYVIAGKPGAGKTYWAVQHLLSKYYFFEKKFDEYLPKTDVRIVTNIDGLRLDHHQLDEMIEKAGGKEKFFTVDYQKKLLGVWHRIVYIIDEAHKYFPAKYSNDDVMYFFQYHRHLGIDMYLITSGVSLFPPWIQRVVEYRIQATARSKTFGGFKYNKIVEGDSAGAALLRPDNKVFRLYKSMSQDELEKPKSLVTKYLVFMVIFILCAIGVMYYSLSSMLGAGKKGRAMAANESKAVSKPVQAKKESAPEVQPVSKKQEEGPIIRGPVLHDMLENFERVQINWSEKGEPVVAVGERLIPKELIGKIMENCVVIGGKIFVEKKGKRQGGDVLSEHSPPPMQAPEPKWIPPPKEPGVTIYSPVSK